ncbi:MAG TPA: hypothetical protein VIV60_01725 [Polyangiaceae bacterium]
MTYRPTERVFLPPWQSRLPSLIYLVIAVVVLVIVLMAEQSSSNSELYVRVIEHNARRIIAPRTFAILLCVSAFSAVLRTSMRGVRIRGDGIEYRDVVALAWPKLRRFRWPQVDCIIFDIPGEIAIDLWDGSRAFLPRVGDRDGLVATLETVAAARAIPVRGGMGLDEIPEAEELEQDPAV